jgi:small subunit ribosomal protein S1
MFQNFIVKQLNADAQESSASTEATATTNEPAQTQPVVEDTGAHDDFDWSIDKRNVATYSKEEKVKYDNVYEGTFKAVSDGELVKGLVVALTKTDVVINIGFKSDGFFQRIPRSAHPENR